MASPGVATRPHEVAPPGTAAEVLMELAVPERTLLSLRLGQAGEGPLTLAEAAERIGMSLAEALRLEQAAIHRLGPARWEQARRLLRPPDER